MQFQGKTMAMVEGATRDIIEKNMWLRRFFFLFCSFLFFVFLFFCFVLFCFVF